MDGKVETVADLSKLGSPTSESSFFGGITPDGSPLIGSREYGCYPDLRPGANGIGRLTQEITPGLSGTQFRYDVMGRIAGTNW
jgi:hypothetical protein